MSKLSYAEDRAQRHTHHILTTIYKYTEFLPQTKYVQQIAFDSLRQIKDVDIQKITQNR